MPKNPNQDPEATPEVVDAKPVVAMCTIEIGLESFQLPVHETHATPTAYLKGGTVPRVRLDDGAYYPVVLTKRDRVSGKTFDYVVRGRVLEAAVLNENGISERKRIFRPIARCVERVRPPGEIVKPEERFETVVSDFKVME